MYFRLNRPKSLDTVSYSCVMTSQSTTLGQSSHNQKKKKHNCVPIKLTKTGSVQTGLAYPSLSTPSLDEILKKQKVNASFETIPPPHIG